MGGSVLSREIKEQRENAPRPAKTGEVMKWRARYEQARQAYGEQLDQFRLEEEEYDGSGTILPKPGGMKAQSAPLSRNAVYELIETEVEPTVPKPKVQALHEGEEDSARLIEALLQRMAAQLPMEAVNDSNERETYLHGGSFVQIDWDMLGGLHRALGSVSVQDLATRQVIPQPGGDWLEELDWYFIVQPMTREKVKRVYRREAADMECAENEQTGRGEEKNAQSGDRLTVITAFYKNEDGGIGKFSWCGDTVLEDEQDYLHRHQRVCARCGAPMAGDECTECGGRAWKRKTVKEVPLPRDLCIPSACAPGGVETVAAFSLQSTENGGWRQVPTMAPVYRMKHFPTVMRKNISAKGRFMGMSDAKTILPMQQAMKKLDTKILEKLLKGGSYVTLPQGVSVETTDRELKVIRLRTPAEKALIDVITVQPNIASDIAVRSSYYQDMKSCLGITDAYQGKQDITATSGTAKRISVSQAAGRLESKRVMKNRMWGEMYRVMFEMWLLFSDDEMCVHGENPLDGEYRTISKWDFLRRDAGGQLYWNDEFLFGVETEGANPADRTAMQERIRSDFQAGMYGEPKLVDSRIRMWKMMSKYGAPGAKTMLDMALEEKRSLSESEREVRENGVPDLQQSFEDRIQPGEGDGR